MIDDSLTSQVQGLHFPLENLPQEGLHLSYNGKLHTVDSIFNHKVTHQGLSLFQLVMCCECCKGRKYWFSRKEIEKSGCAGLEELMNQIQEMHQYGIDISSQMTYYNEDLSDCSFDVDEPQLQ